MQKDSRQKVKYFESQFIKKSQNGLQKTSNQMYKVLMDTIINCQNKQCFEKKIASLQQLDRNTYSMWQYVGSQVQQCISREYNNQGIEGYTKCFAMFGRLVDWETRKSFMKDENVKKGIRQSIQSKQYHKLKEQSRKLLNPQNR